MPSWSSLWRGARVGEKLRGFVFLNQKRHMSDHREMAVIPSRFQWEKFKDLLHYYTCVGLIPVGLILAYCNIFIGPATLEPIPEGYTPKHWEYHKHPVTRFIARYLQHPPQQDYEKFMHFLHEESEKIELRELEKRIQRKMYERNDYQAYYYRPALGKYIRAYKEDLEQRWYEMGDE